MRDEETSKSSNGFKAAATAIVIVAIIAAVVVFVKDEAFKNPTLADFIYCYQEENVKNCVRGLDDTSFCKYKGTKDVKCTTKKLTEKQFVITEQKKSN